MAILTVLIWLFLTAGVWAWWVIGIPVYFVIYCLMFFGVVSVTIVYNLTNNESMAPFTGGLGVVCGLASFVGMMIALVRAM